jgi:hypothetical protein
LFVVISLYPLNFVAKLGLFADIPKFIFLHFSSAEKNLQKKFACFMKNIYFWRVVFKKTDRKKLLTKKNSKKNGKNVIQKRFSRIVFAAGTASRTPVQKDARR